MLLQSTLTHEDWDYLVLVFFIFFFHSHKQLIACLHSVPSLIAVFHKSISGFFSFLALAEVLSWYLCGDLAQTNNLPKTADHEFEYHLMEKL
ncbi:MAG: hypothetical protein ACRC4N_11895 [Gammaproteobacteria bacterium]